MVFSRVMYVLFLITLIYLAGFAWFLGQISYKETILNEKADAIIVLTGAKGRIDTGLHLLSKGYGQHLFISGVGQNTALSDLSKFLSFFPSDQVKTLESLITLGHEADSTEGNAVESLEWIKQNHYKRIILVTSNYHMLRSLYLFKHFIPDITIIPYPLINNVNSQLIFLEYNKYLLCLLK